ncbi:hypothetical protein A2272_04010 [Candidatus Peregrinibacteria bacterium RIFOXYA12_FULL_33_12]|nr:MAG: hypothetical protein A2263_03770 [Candidatus Peregrinibacteria bacterium RIFOXYA2_FULL_33_21]OGJ46599.1 MAG: hypothetical protein A2272_04010 [Candidatus Peregrinibacteria bacterium RIFOXYA12_FULL_33_12]OGJ51477.1 MAG: hypothetical protein A2307_00205 [Candidatus Peregrinibacteria bacterium RIFOXYB2_FULL_33_20]
MKNILPTRSQANIAYTETLGEIEKGQKVDFSKFIIYFYKPNNTSMENRRDYLPPELEWLPEELPFPMKVNIFTQDTSKFAEAHAKLLELGLIPKPLRANSRPLEEIRQTPNLGWQRENCLVLPVPGKEHMASTDANGWGIYRVVFKKGNEGSQYTSSNSPLVEFKYCLKSTPGEDFIRNNVLTTNPMGKHLRQLLQILNPTEIIDEMGNPLNNLINCPFSTSARRV